MMKFNNSQQKAIRHKDGPMLVLAGPGSGKTAVITRRTQYLIEECHADPSQILVITFTRAAAMEMKQRFEKLTGHGTKVSFGTFHAVFFAILREAYHYDKQNIISEEQKLRIMREILSHIQMEYQLEYQDEQQFIRELFIEIGVLKNQKISPEHYYSTTCGAEVFREIYRAYENRLKKSRLIDYDDMLVYTFELFRERPDILQAWQKKFRYILIDEFQDINRIQYEIIKMLALPDNNLFVVGDDDQSIYRFRGSRPEIMMHFPRDYVNAERVVLDVNYRCGKYITETSLNLISHNKERFAKKIRANSKSDHPVLYAGFENKKAECSYIASQLRELAARGMDYRNIAVLFRTNSQPRMLCEYLMEYQIPFRIKDSIQDIYSHWIAKDLFTYMAIAAGSRSRADFLQIMNRPNRYLSRDSLADALVSFADWKDYYRMQERMLIRIDKLQKDLSMLKKLSPYAAINYIRKGMGYDAFLDEFAKTRGTDPAVLFDVIDELQLASAGFKTMEEWQAHIREYSAKMRQLARGKEEQSEGVLLATLHSAKGLEFDAVFLLDVNEGIMPYKKASGEKELEEERRLFYVGMTRAKELLYLCYLKDKGNSDRKPSRFLEESKKRQQR